MYHAEVKHNVINKLTISADITKYNKITPKTIMSQLFKVYQSCHRISPSESDLLAKLHQVT